VTSRPASPHHGAVIGFTDWRELRRRFPRLVLGLLPLGIGVGLTICAHLGVSPYDVLHQGIAKQTGISFGSVVVLVGIVVLLLWIPLRQRPGVGTVVNTLTVGYITNATIIVVGPVDGFALRWTLLVAGVLVTAVGIGLYIGCGLGPGPRDGLMTGIAARGYPLWGVRTSLELCACVLGFVLGGNVGIGTLVFAFGIGPFGHFFLNRFHLGVDSSDPDPDATFAE
jgi:uncharacterized membrane protein YczE